MRVRASRQDIKSVMTRLAYPGVIAWFDIALTLAVLIGLLVGPLFYRWWLLGHATPGEEFAEALVDGVSRAFSGPKAV
jgi:hypothetical protein